MLVLADRHHPQDILSPSDIDRLFFELDSDHSGQVPIAEVKKHLMDALCKCKTSYNKVRGGPVSLVMAGLWPGGSGRMRQRKRGERGWLKARFNRGVCLFVLPTEPCIVLWSDLIESRASKRLS